MRVASYRERRKIRAYDVKLTGPGPVFGCAGTARGRRLAPSCPLAPLRRGGRLVDHAWWPPTPAPAPPYLPRTGGWLVAARRDIPFVTPHAIRSRSARAPDSRRRARPAEEIPRCRSARPHPLGGPVVHCPAGPGPGDGAVAWNHSDDVRAEAVRGHPRG